MHFPLKIALTAVLAKSTIAELSASQTQQPNELEHQFQPPVFHHQRDFAHQTADFDQNQVGFNPNTDAFGAAQTAYANYQDPVQQYVSGYADGVQADQQNVHGSVDPYSGYPSPSPYRNIGAYNTGAFSVQSGYEGYLVPGPPHPKSALLAEESPSSNFPVSMRQVSSYLRTALSLFARFISLTVFGGGIATAICTFTPLCTISFASPLIPVRSVQENVKNLAEPYIGPEMAEMVQNAVDKFSKMQTEEKEKMVAKSTPDQPESDLKEDLSKTDKDSEIKME